MKGIRKLCILLSMLFLLSGCASILLLGAGAGLGVASYMYVDGRLSVEYPLEYSRAWDAANSALESMEISVSSTSNEMGKGSIDAVRKDGKKVSVILKDKGNKITVIAIRVGTFGDRTESQKIHNKIIAIAGI